MYRWHKDYPLGNNPLAKLSAPTVLRKIRDFARDFGLYQSVCFDSEVLSTKLDEELDRCVSKEYSCTVCTDISNNDGKQSSST